MDKLEGKVTSKGQLVIPAKLRRALRIGRGRGCAFERIQGGIAVYPKQVEDIERLPRHFGWSRSATRHRTRTRPGDRVRIHVLDASALYRFISQRRRFTHRGGPLQTSGRGQQPLLMSAVNWGEVYYSLVKRIGLSKTDNMLAEVSRTVPISLVERDAGGRRARCTLESPIPPSLR